MRGSRILLTSAVSLGTVFAAVGIASPAFADNTDYSGAAAPAVLGEVAQRPVTQVAPTAATNQALPITGGDIAEMAVVGFAMLGTGTVLVRRSRRRA